MSEYQLPGKTNVHLDELQSVIKEILLIDSDEWVDDKVVQITVEFMAFPKKININISKK
ncbi:MAG: hypothetical protein KKE62_06010 [Proteobacteria bacterium]|nr:hypothetical protein [Pseudomonadota bacterium]MBU1542382.1 hypothetical protein [Pseudomonadota bacterium]MBU2430820.1 hypothetical protein [Pseudomonadota bacterium]